MQNKEKMKYRIAGCVILYFIDEEVIDNIESYINKVDRLYVVDNGGEEFVFQS